MGVNEIKESIEQFRRALHRLEEVLQRSAEDDIVIDAAIQRLNLRLNYAGKP